MIINDPVHGFIEIPKGILTSLVKHPIFVRLNRIEQLGPTSYVYPGGRHTRFSHSIGAFHLISEALTILQRKGCAITPTEAEGAKIAMLLHDIGHGPMSHTLEGCFVHGLTHEDMTLLLMQQLDREFDGQLQLAISIFTDTYPKHFLHELICSQLDMDRLDYLCRDSFFAGVREGNIGAERIIKMLNVNADRLVVEQKGIYTIENYLMARRLMYWQVYLHKTALAAQQVLLAVLQRADELIAQRQRLPASATLQYFLHNTIDRAYIQAHPEALANYILLDDSDLLSALKQWMQGSDKVLALLAANYINRRLFRAKELTAPLADDALHSLRTDMAAHLGITPSEARYFVRPLRVSQMLYSTSDDHITILMKDGTVRDISDFSELLHSEMVDRRSERHYVFLQRKDN
ncbi:MAG: HD domain-containing protein [Bacteroidaceae bacterium]|nr:HD domain-containing protein [Bacteroidaceae bacterium]